jgi:uncharacterized membrane protein
MTSTSANDLPTADGGHIRGNPIAWTAVALICGGFAVAGIALIEAMPWLFFIGAGVVAIGAVLSWLTHAMSNVRTRSESPVGFADAASAAEPVEAPEPA